MTAKELTQAAIDQGFISTTGKVSCMFTLWNLFILTQQGVQWGQILKLCRESIMASCHPLLFRWVEQCSRHLPPSACVESAEDCSVQAISQAHWSVSCTRQPSNTRIAGVTNPGAALNPVLTGPSTSDMRADLVSGCLRCLQTPELTMASSLYMDIKTKERRSAFTKPEEGKFGLRAWKQ